MKQNVNNDVTKDSPTEHSQNILCISIIQFVSLLTLCYECSPVLWLDRQWSLLLHNKLFKQYCTLSPISASLHGRYYIKRPIYNINICSILSLDVHSNKVLKKKNVSTMSFQTLTVVTASCSLIKKKQLEQLGTEKQFHAHQVIVC